ncbi:MAG: 16S rRNA (cytidine(1402)-2'-O)-methyltransferase [Flavobacteriales bacterium]|nr:16S rRNA (cytidine(1402)-2'-O)-methyltransferase [Flavobacteriales bacterium]
MSKLYLVPTPVGNLADMTYRAVEVLEKVDLILAEDTRTTGKILKHYEISTPSRSFHAHNEHKVLEQIVEELESGRELALVSDAGTPGISDPGFLLTRACYEKGIEVTCLPGATAVIPASVMSGMPTDRFVFEGFLPHKKGRQKRILEWENEHRTVVFYESPYRVIKCLQQLEDLLDGEREIAAIREISKIYEEVVRGSITEVKAHFEQNPPKGEFVMVLAGKS